MALFDFSYTKTETNAIRTKSLFWELDYESEYSLFTLKEEECIHKPTGRVLLPIGKLFIEMTVDDPTEYDFADAVFGSWAVWDKIRNSDKRLVAEIEKWRLEADVRRKALAFKTLLNEVKNDGKASFSAAKYLLEEGWKKTDARTADGRKDRAKQREQADKAFDRAGIQDDLKRLKEQGLIQ